MNRRGGRRPTCASVSPQDWDACARRELEEETGMRAGELIPLFDGVHSFGTRGEVSGFCGGCVLI